jgi:carbamate kinase
MNKRIVIALGGNALGTTLEEQFHAVHVAARAIVDLVRDGYNVVIVHGNGPQVGIINNAMVSLMHDDPSQGITPLSVCGAMSEAYIGYDLQNAIREELLDRGMVRPVCTLITQTEVAADDPAFQNPTKPIGLFYSEEEARQIAADTGYTMKEDSGRGWRRYVASPKPLSIVEAPCVRMLSDGGAIVIACGGGGIPVIAQGHSLRGAGAVVDKDFASELMAEEMDADMLLILTAVEQVAINFGKPNQQGLSDMTPAQAARYIDEGQFAPGSMLPKVQAAVKFVRSKPGRTALITLLEKAKDGLAGKTGTRIHE